ncbi:MAG: STAS domain-containing protein [Proteobacteria bacterium]|nr:STAS domain-containing protein [Pseudomonadota bacterium]
MLLVTKKRVSDVSLVMLSGSLTVHSHGDLQNSIVECTNGPGDNILLSLECLDKISSSGIGILVTACVEIVKQGRILKLVMVPTDILEKLDMYKVLPLFSIFNDVESAVKQVKLDEDKKGKNFVRLFERIDVKIGARFRRHKSGKEGLVRGFQDATAMNLTKRGMFIMTDATIEADTLIDVKLSLGKGFLKKESVSFLGKVVRRLEATEEMSSGLALIILHMDDDEMGRLEKHLKRHEKKS